MFGFFARTLQSSCRRGFACSTGRAKLAHLVGWVSCCSHQPGEGQATSATKRALLVWSLHHPSVPCTYSGLHTSNLSIGCFGIMVLQFFCPQIALASWCTNVVHTSNLFSPCPYAALVEIELQMHHIIESVTCNCPSKTLLLYYRLIQQMSHRVYSASLTLTGAQ